MVQRKFKLKVKQVIEPICDLRLKPKLTSNLETQLLFGEKIKIINEDQKQWVFCQSIEDDYTGYIKKNHLGDLKSANYKITNLSSFIYKAPDIKSCIVSKLFLIQKYQLQKLKLIGFQFLLKTKIITFIIEISIQLINTLLLLGLIYL